MPRARFCLQSLCLHAACPSHLIILDLKVNITNYEISRSIFADKMLVVHTSQKYSRRKFQNCLPALNIFHVRLSVHRGRGGDLLMEVKIMNVV
jgi:hypothetical protein